MNADYSPMFKHWRTDISLAPHDGSIFMGRIIGTNRAVATSWRNGCFNDVSSGHEKPIEICQWISFTEFADIRLCVWRTPT